MIVNKRVLAIPFAAVWVLAVQARQLAPVTTTAGSMGSAATSGISAKNLAGPRIEFAANLWDFGRVMAGVPLQHTFTFTNTGHALLEVRDVVPSCGCTPAGQWSKQVEPGRTGVIPVQLRSGSLNGPLLKTVKVTCNDPATPELTLQIKGSIWKPVEIKPPVVFFYGTAVSKSVSRVVRIINNEDQPLVLSAPESDSRGFVAEVKTNQTGKEFRLVIKTVPPLSAGWVKGRITLRTSSTNAPVLTVTAFADVQTVIAVTPSQLLLPTGRLDSALSLSVKIRSTVAEALVLSDASVNAKDVKVRLQEAGRDGHFTAVVDFPQGFEIPQGRQVELSLKSNYPLSPLVRVPIMHRTQAIGSSAPIEEIEDLPPGGPANR